MSGLDRFRSRQQSIEPALSEQQRLAKPTPARARRGEKCYAALGCTWIDRLQKTKRRDVLKIAICLMQAYFFTKCTTIKLTNVVLRPWNVDKRSKQEALEEMEEAGMIQVERLGKCRAPIVHILNTEELPNVRF